MTTLDRSYQLLALLEVCRHSANHIKMASVKVVLKPPQASLPPSFSLLFPLLAKFMMQ